MLTLFFLQQIKTSDPARFIKHITGLIEQAKTEEGIEHYCIATDPKDPNTMHVFERYESKAAFEKHMANDKVKELTALDIVTEMNIQICRVAGFKE